MTNQKFGKYFRVKPSPMTNLMFDKFSKVKH